MNGYLLNDKRLECAIHKKRNEREPNEGAVRFTNLFVKNFDKGTTDD